MAVRAANILCAPSSMHSPALMAVMVDAAAILFCVVIKIYGLYYIFAIIKTCLQKMGKVAAVITAQEDLEKILLLMCRSALSHVMKRQETKKQKYLKTGRKLSG